MGGSSSKSKRLYGCPYSVAVSQGAGGSQQAAAHVPPIYEEADLYMEAEHTNNHATLYASSPQLSSVRQPTALSNADHLHTGCGADFCNSYAPSLHSNDYDTNAGNGYLHPHAGIAGLDSDYAPSTRYSPVYLQHLNSKQAQPQQQPQQQHYQQHQQHYQQQALQSYPHERYQRQAAAGSSRPSGRRLRAGAASRRRKIVLGGQQRGAQHERQLAMNDDQRARSGQLGLLPAAIQDQELQSRAVLNFLDNCQDELAKYMYLRNLKDFNERLFYYTLMRHVERLMPLVYTPTVGLACQKFSQIYMRPRGLFVTARDLGRVRQVVANWAEKDVRVIVVTDGERILGLGDLGANGMGISIGKLSLYTALAGIPPQNVLPVTIDVGTENESNLEDPFYIGLRQRRLRGANYDQLIEEFMEAVVERWGRSCLIQFEDFGNATAFALLERYRNHFCTFNDDIQGTASVSLSGLLTAARLIGRRLADCTFLFYGAGEANLGTASLLIMAMQEDGLSREQAKRRIFLVDSKGLLVRSRADLSAHKLQFAQDGPHLRELEAIVEQVKPTALIGASAQAHAFTESICKKMAQHNERPIIFALSNPTSKAECTAAEAYQWTGAKCVFASGSPFAPVQMNGRTYVTGQGNNAYIFPGVGLAAIAAHTHLVPEQIFLVAARALSDQVTGGDIELGLIYPRLGKIREVTLRVATRCLEYFYAERLANYCPEPSNKEEFLKTLQYDPTY